MWRYIDKVQFVGKSHSIQTVEIIDFIENSNDEECDFIKIYHEGLKYFYNRNWDLAIDKFKISLNYETKNYSKHINPSKLFIERAEFYKLNPPLEDWDGSTILTKK